MILRYLLLLIVLCGCEPFDDRADYYVDALARNIYFVGRLPDGAASANVLLSTVPLPWSALPIEPVIRVVSFSAEGDNIFESTLGDGELRNPVRGEYSWTWAGTVPFPPPLFPGGETGARLVGVELPVSYYIEAVRSRPVGYEFCRVEILGPGVYECGEWIDVLIANDVRCRGQVRQLVDCHGLNFAIVPDILIAGFGQRDRGLVPMDTQFKYWSVPGLIFVHDSEGWRYAEAARVPRRGEPATPLTYRGPFREADDAARDFATTIGARYTNFGRFADAIQDEDARQLMDALDARLAHLDDQAAGGRATP